MLNSGRLVAESIEKILKDHSTKHISSDLSSQITVRRTHIWEDSLRLFRRIDASKTLRVTFLGEAGVDDGRATSRVPQAVDVSDQQSGSFVNWSTF